MAEFVWNAGSRLTKKVADPQVIGDTLEILQLENAGRLTARIVVDAARPIESPMHPLFEWDSERAAELYRESQARHVLASIRIMQPRSDPREAPRMIHAYVSIAERLGDDVQRAYIPIARVFNDADLLRQAVERAAAELRAFEDRYAEFDGIARAARTAREKIEQTLSEPAA
jgi:hypothetical protein